MRCNDEALNKVIRVMEKNGTCDFYNIEIYVIINNSVF